MDIPQWKTYGILLLPGLDPRVQALSQLVSDGIHAHDICANSGQYKATQPYQDSSHACDLHSMPGHKCRSTETWALTAKSRLPLEGFQWEIGSHPPAFQSSYTPLWKYASLLQLLSSEPLQLARDSCWLCRALQTASPPLPPSPFCYGCFWRRLLLFACEEACCLSHR